MPLLRSADWKARLEIFILACVVAPVVEETMFRGVLHRHLREATSRLGRGRSIFLSATLVGFVFAVIHPQGWLAVPALMAPAYAFTIAREWRGSLLPRNRMIPAWPKRIDSGHGWVTF